VQRSRAGEREGKGKNPSAIAKGPGMGRGKEASKEGGERCTFLRQRRRIREKRGKKGVLEIPQKKGGNENVENF